MGIARRGATLFELVVASAIALVLLLATYQLMVPGLRIWASTNERGHPQQQVVSVVNRLQHDLKLTTLESLTIDTQRVHDPDLGTTEPASALSFLSPVGDDGAIRVRNDGSMVWHHFVVAYLDPARHQIVLGTRPLATTDAGEVVMRLDHFLPDPDDRVLARQVRGFLVDSPLDPSSEEPLRVNLVRVVVHARDLHHECTLGTNVTTLIDGDLPGGATGG